MSEPFDEYIPYQFTPGGNFILDQPDQLVSVWGEGDEVLWADGEALTIAGGQGLGKTTIAQQLALGRAGIPEYSELLGKPIQPSERNVLYLAMDRPRQAARSFRRMVGEVHRAELDAKLLVWQGPPPYDMATVTAILTRLCTEANADTVIVDSIKDAALGLTDDAVGAGYNRARQHALAEGIQVCELHHTRKTSQGGTRELGVDAIFGSTWITAGAGSVILLTGDPGDPVVNFRQVKQPMNECGPWRLVHDHWAGRSSLVEGVDLVAAADRPCGITAGDAAALMFEVQDPSRSQIEKARRRLDRLVDGGQLKVLVAGGRGSSNSATWGRA